MAGEEKQVGGLPNVGIDMNKLPLYGQDDERLAELNQAQRDAISALEQRYQKPNWFKVAAGFAKPQLGGFLASVGSAAEAFGENIEQERANKLPVAQMKLQLAQSNMLLGANKKVADQIKKWKDEHPGETPSAQLVGEWAATAPGSSTVEALKNELKYQQDQQTQTLQRIKQKQDANIPLSPDEMGYLKNIKPEGTPRDTTKPAPAGATTTTPTTGAEPAKEEKAKPNNVYILPSGARANEDVYNLHKSGIPIISNIRTKEEQEALRDPNNPKFTKEGRPVATDSKHFTGDAIDLDPSKKLTAPQLKILEEQGWKQTNPKNDPNHWEREPAKVAEIKPQPSAPAPAKAGEIYPQSLPRPDTEGLGSEDRRIQIEQHGASAKALEAPYQESVGNLQAVATGPSYTRIKNSYDNAIRMIDENPELARKVFAMVRQDPIQAALAEGFGVHAGAFNANVSLPVKAFLDAGLPESAKNYADKLFSSIMNITMANLRSQGVAMGKVPQQEYMKALSGFVSPDQTAPAALNLLHHSRAEFDHNKEYYDTIQKELPRTKGSPTPYADIHNNSENLKKIDRKYDAIKRKYDADYRARLKGG
jgi:hypothetical protein